MMDSANILSAIFCLIVPLLKTQFTKQKSTLLLSVCYGCETRPSS